MTHRILFLLLALGLTANSTTWAQELHEPRYIENNAGDLDFRTYFYGSFVGTHQPAIYFVPDAGFTGDLFVATAEREPGWVQLANDREWNGFSLSNVGTGRAPEPPSEDLIELTDKAIYGAMQLGIATGARVVFAQGLGAAFVIKAKSIDDRFRGAGILLDPIGPRGAQPMLDIDAETILAHRDAMDERFPAMWGMGKGPDELYPDIDMTPDGVADLRSRYELDQPPYWAAALTGFDGGLEVREPIRLKDWPVLIVRGVRASAEQIAREESVAKWLEERGALVERLKLSDLGLRGLTQLPMSGSNAAAVLNYFIDWAEAKGLGEPASVDPNHPGGRGK